MLNHVVMLGGTARNEARVRRALGDAGPQLSRTAESQPLAPGVCAVLPEDASSALIEAASILCGRNLAVLALLSEAIDCREGLVRGSSMRLVEHAGRFAEVLGLGAEDRLSLERAALLRDIGKLRILNDVLLKPDLLTYDEWAVIQRHPHFGADLVAEIEGFQDIEAVVRCHHESYDGDGYPERLEGEQIPFLARALKIIDVYCAMTSPRHYRTGTASHKEAVAHIRDERGKHFDPELADVFLKAKVGIAPVAPRKGKARK